MQDKLFINLLSLTFPYTKKSLRYLHKLQITENQVLKEQIENKAKLFF